MSLILCIETGTDVCSVALAQDGRLLSLRESGEGKGHAQNLAIYVDEILTENNMSTRDLDAVAVGMGPGSYTGLRIGTSLAKGICFACDIPMIAISSLRSMAHCALEDFKAGILDSDTFKNRILAPMIDARRMEVYTQLFDDKLNPLTDIVAEVVTEDSFAIYRDRDFVIFGNGAEKCKDVMNVESVKFENISISARSMVSPAQEMFDKKEFVDVAYFEPFYLKDFIGTTKKKNPLLAGLAVKK